MICVYLQGLETPFKVPEIQEFPVGDMFTPIVLRRKTPRIKSAESLHYIPSWKRGSRVPLLYQEKPPTKNIKPPFTELPTCALNRPALSSVSQNHSDARFGSNSVAGVPEKQKENIELNRTVSMEIANQVSTPKDVVVESAIDLNETMSLEIALTRRGLPSVRKHELVVWPYNVTFKDDKKLTYNAIEEDMPGIFKEPLPKRPETLDLATTESSSREPSIGEGTSRLPPRIAELFKEQWLSPFSVLYLTKILSAFYKVGITSHPKRVVPPASCLGLFYELNPSIQNAFKNSLKRRSRELQKLDGPASFSLLHKLSGKNALQSSLPVRPVLVGADGDYVSVAPNCLKSWRKLLLEPFSGPRDVAYVVVAPDSDLVLENTKQFFKELSMIYEVRMRKSKISCYFCNSFRNCFFGFCKF